MKWAIVYFLHRINIFRYIKNWLFCLRFPFYRMSDKKNPFTRYDYTWYDEIPYGWRKAFGIEMSKEIKRVGKACIKDTNRNEKHKVGWKDILQFQQIKEKYGSLRIYANAIEDFDLTFEKYELLSIGYCLVCGQPSRYITKGWISYQCEKCFVKHLQRWHHTNDEIEEYKKKCRITKKDIPSLQRFKNDSWIEIDVKDKFDIDFEKMWNL